MAGTAALVIDRLACEYQVPPAHPSPDPLRWRLDHIVRTRLAAACASALEPALDPDDPSVWLVDRMECELATDVGEDDDAIPRVMELLPQRRRERDTPRGVLLRVRVSARGAGDDDRVALAGAGTRSCPEEEREGR